MNSKESFAPAPHFLDSATRLTPVVIGMVHIPPLPGSPNYRAGFHAEGFERVIEFCAADAKSLADGGVDAIMIENFGDVPFYKDNVPQITVACMTAVALAVKAAGKGGGLPIGINVLRNDAAAALAVATAVQAAFIRVNILSGARLTDQGIIEGRASTLLRDRQAIGSQHIRILADVDVKHSAALAPRSLEEEIAELVERSGADGVILSGQGTGKETPINKVKQAAQVSPTTPLFIGSGIGVNNLQQYLGVASGFIVGSSLKKNGILAAPVDTAKVREFVGMLRKSLK